MFRKKEEFIRVIGKILSEWPWGNDKPDTNRCNFNLNVGDTTPVGRFSPQGDSPYGCADMAGNVWEWTHSVMTVYPYQIISNGREMESGDEPRACRGGSYTDIDRRVRCAYRSRKVPKDSSGQIGFRVLASPISEFGQPYDLKP